VPLPRAFYRRPAPVVARALLGCVLVSRRGRVATAGRIVETEAYLGPEDAASHAAFRPSSRHLFYGDGGHAYVFVNYGIHLCLNAITGPPGTPGCVLIRALEPLTGLAAMARRRGVAAGSPRLASGPGNVTRALGVTLGDSGADLTAGRLTVEPRRGPRRPRLARGPRVGITRAVEPPLRFWIAGSPHVSRRGRRNRPPSLGPALRTPGGRPAGPPCAGAVLRRAAGRARALRRSGPGHNDSPEGPWSR
jgi:DNA-3-methyladenine glycosylase